MEESKCEGKGPSDLDNNNGRIYSRPGRESSTEGAKASPESPAIPYKDFTGKVPLNPDFRKRFKKANSATFKMDGMHFTIGKCKSGICF